MIVDRVYYGAERVLSVLPDKDEQLVLEAEGGYSSLILEKDGKPIDACTTDKWRYARIGEFAPISTLFSDKVKKTIRCATPEIKSACDEMYGGAANAFVAIFTAPELLAGIAKAGDEAELRARKTQALARVSVEPFESKEAAEKYLEKVHKEEGGDICSVESFFKVVKVAEV